MKASFLALDLLLAQGALADPPEAHDASAPRPRSRTYLDPSTGRPLPDSRDACALAGRLLGKYRHPNFDLIVGGKSPFEPRSSLYGFDYIKDVSIDVSKRTDAELQSMAEHLAAGVRRPKAEVLQALRAAKASGAPLSLKLILPKEAAAKTDRNVCGTNCIQEALRWDQPGLDFGGIPGPNFQGIGEQPFAKAMKHFETNYKKIEEGEQIPFGALVVFRSGPLVMHMSRYLGPSNNSKAEKGKTETLLWENPTADPRDPISFQTIENHVAYFVNDPNFKLEFYRYDPQ